MTPSAASDTQTAGLLTSIEALMPCLFLLLTRIALVLMCFFAYSSNPRAISGLVMILPVGVTFLPVTMMVFAWDIINHVPLDGKHLFEGESIFMAYVCVAHRFLQFARGLV
jgi:hypothetical protein